MERKPLTETQCHALLAEVKRLAVKFARSSNTGRADAGKHLLQLLRDVE